MALSIELPSGEVVFGFQPIIKNGNFTWNEATKNLTRKPHSLAVERRIITTAREMQKIRMMLDNYPLKIHSWYRPETENSRVGGSKNSRHLFGDGVDFSCKQLRPMSIYLILNNLHTKGGLKAYNSFVHIDWRGYFARW